jgi:hypothetical protein
MLDELRPELLAALERQRELRRRRRVRRRRVGVLVAAAAVLTLVIAGYSTLRGERSASADVDVIVDGNDLVVRLTDLHTRPREIVAAAKRFGIDLRIEQVPVGPSNVGRFVDGGADSLPPDITTLGRVQQTFTGFRIPRGWPGTLTLDIGRSARAGERWQAASDALEQDEPLACQPLLGATVKTVAHDLRSQRLTARWLLLPSPGPVADPAPYGSWKVVQLQALGPHEIWVVASRDGSWPMAGEPATMPTDC